MLFTKKRNAKAIAVALALTIIFTATFSNVASASVGKYEEYSAISGLPLEYIEKISKIYGENFLEESILEYVSNDSEVSPASLEDPNLPENPIGLALYEQALTNGVKGQIWITKDGNFGNINHGHAGILYANTIYYRGFIEHRGYKAQDSLSQYYEWDWGSGDTWWSTVHTLRTYNVNTPESLAEGLPYDEGTMISAADYAMANLLGWSYEPLAPKLSPVSVNCATLVYKAYANADKYNGNAISLGNPLSPTVIPKDLVEDGHLTLAYRAQWDGDEHIWNEE